MISVSLGAGPDQLAALIRSLEKRHGLLVLDNIEHLVAAVGVAVRALLKGAPQMRMLATGQVSLRANEEHVFQLSPLAQPRSGDTLEVARTSPAFALLEARVRARDDRFSVTPASLPKVISLLRALDGLPLAIEMAAARIPALGLELGGGQLVERLKRMHSIDSAAPARHRTLWAALTWSYELLPASNQTLLGLLANFVGTFGQTQAVAAAGAVGLEANVALEALEGLVDRSLVQMVTTDPPRYRMLETTRQFAVERLKTEGLAEKAELAHKEAMVSLAEAVEHWYWRQAEEAWLRCYRPDYDNLQLAFDRAIAQNDMPAAATLGLALLRIDHTNDVTPPRQRRGKLLHAGIATADLLARARSWTCLSLWSIVLVPGLTFPESARQCLAAWRLLEDKFGLHEALCLQASALARTGQLKEARSALLEARSLEKSDWPLRSLAFGLGARYDVELYSGQFPAALEAVASEWALLRQSGMYRLATLVRAKIPDLQLLVGRRDEAVVTGQAVVAELRQMELPAFLGYALSNLCGAMLMTGEERYQRAVPALAAESWRLTSVHGRAHLLFGVTALFAARQGKSEIALKLLGAADSWYRTQEVLRSPVTTLLECNTTDLAISSLGLQRSAALRAAAASQGEAEVQGWVYQALGAIPN